MTATVAQIKALHDQRCELEKQIKQVADLYQNGDEWKPEDKAKWDALNAEYNGVYAQLQAENNELAQQAQREQRQREIADRLQSLSGHNSEFEKLAKRIGNDGGSLADGHKFHPDGNITAGPTAETREKALFCWFARGRSNLGVTDEHRTAMQQCGIGAFDELTLNIRSDYDAVKAAFMPKNSAWYPQIFNTLTTHTGNSGGFTIGESFINSLEQAMLAFGGMFQVAEVIRTDNAEPMRWPTGNDTSNSGRQLGESQVVTTLDPTFGQVLWYAYKFTSDEVKVPFELLRDSRFNLAAVLGEMLGIRLGRIQNSKYTTGTGAGTPKGITVGAAAGVTSAVSTTIAFDEIIDLEHSIDPSRRTLPGVGYMFHDNILKLLRKLKDGNGNYLWNRGANGGAPDTLNNRPYQINQDMSSTITSGDITMVFGQLNQYKIRQVGAIRTYRLVERHRENDQDAFLSFVEGDGNLLDAGDNPVKKLTQV